MSIRRAFEVFGLVALLVSVALAPVAVAGEEGAESPEAVAKALQAAGKADDFARIVKLIHPEDRPMMAVGMLMAGGMAAAFSDDAEAAGKEYEAILKKYGLEDMEKSSGPPAGGEKDMAAAAREAMKGVDTAALIPELFAFMEKFMDKGKKDEKFATGELKDLKIEGDTATAKSGEETVRFGKVGDRWFVRMDE